MDKLITIKSNKEDINEFVVDKEMPITNIRVSISREVADKINSWNETKRGSISEELVNTFNPTVVEQTESVEPIEIDDTSVIEETPVVDAEPIVTDVQQAEPVLTDDNSAELMFKNNEPLDEVPVNNMVSIEPSETLTELSNEPSEIVDTKEEQLPVAENVYDIDDDFIFDDGDQSVYDPDEEAQKVATKTM